MAPINKNFRLHALLSSHFVTGTKIAITWHSNQSQLKIFIMPNIYSPTISNSDQMITPPPHQKKSSTLHHIAIVVPHDKLVMKSYMHVWLVIVETHYHNLNTNIKNQDYWLLTSNVGIKDTKGTKLQHRAIFPHVGHIQFAKRYKVKTIIWYTPSNSISWLPSD